MLLIQDTCSEGHVVLSGMGNESERFQTRPRLCVHLEGTHVNTSQVATCTEACKRAGKLTMVLTPFLTLVLPVISD